MTTLPTLPTLPTPLAALVPGPDNGWIVDDDAVAALFPVVATFAGTVQDALHHAEGDVAVHTRLVLDVLRADARFRALPPPERGVVFLACLLHDVAKPDTTVVEEDGRVTARGHSARGAILARRILWELDVPFALREQICGLVRWHQVPFFLVEQEERAAERKALRVAEHCRADLLELVAWADAAGRVCGDQSALLDRVALFGELARELGVARGPFAFQDAHTRFRYFRDERRTRHDLAFDDTRGLVTVLAGLPASGKDTWCRENAGPDHVVVSLDALREEHGLAHDGSQSRVADLAYEQMKVALRRKAPVIWNATNLVADNRNGIIDVADAYGARVRIMVFEAPAATLFERNRARPAPVPAAAYERMLRRWDLPTCCDAHAVDVVVAAAPP